MTPILKQECSPYTVCFLASFQTWEEAEPLLLCGRRPLQLDPALALLFPQTPPLSATSYVTLPRPCLLPGSHRYMSVRPSVGEPQTRVECLMAQALPSGCLRRAPSLPGWEFLGNRRHLPEPRFSHLCNGVMAAPALWGCCEVVHRKALTQCLNHRASG